MTTARPTLDDTPVIPDEDDVSLTAEIAKIDPDDPFAEPPRDVDWPHEFVDFHDERIGVRKPTQQALAAFSLSSGRYVPAEEKNDLTGLFIRQHLSPDSYSHVFARLMDPDDPNYTVATIGDLMTAIVKLASDSADDEE